MSLSRRSQYIPRQVTAGSRSIVERNARSHPASLSRGEGETFAVALKYLRLDGLNGFPQRRGRDISVEPQPKNKSGPVGAAKPGQLPIQTRSEMNPKGIPA